MPEVTEPTGERGKTYVCRTCEGEFVIPSDETAVCCPICRMNPVRAVD
jgi:rubrerythrin